MCPSPSLRCLPLLGGGPATSTMSCSVQHKGVGLCPEPSKGWQVSSPVCWLKSQLETPFHVRGCGPAFHPFLGHVLAVLPPPGGGLFDCQPPPGIRQCFLLTWRAMRASKPCLVLLCGGAPSYMCVLLGVSLRPGVFWLVASCLFLVLVFAPLQDPLMRTNSPVGGNAAFVKKRATGSAKAPLSVGVFEDDGGVVVGMS
jgi:hypothetical protein